MIRSLGSRTPKIAPTAWVSEAAYVVGDVQIGEHTSIWPGVTIRGDGDKSIVIGKFVNIQEGSVIHGNGMLIEDNVSIGHSVVVHCNRVGSGSLLGNNSTILNGVTIGEECLIAANSVVLADQSIPDRSFATGIPSTIKRSVTEAQINRMANTAKHLASKAKEFKDSGI